jgi:BirA family biotin operon repressor/biotin-[acetyl-CoA-carboxylase] ligase
LTGPDDSTPFDLAATRAVPGVAGWRRLALGDVGSTNDIAMQAALGGDDGRLWVTATRQLQGRGRRGRAWVSEPGNLYASALIVLERPDIVALGGLPLVAGLAVHDALCRAAPHLASAFAVKWPNDILFGRAKLAGILIEGAPLADGRHAVVIGCGVNIAHRPAETPYPATTLAAEGSDVSAEGLFGHLADALQAALVLWAGATGMAAVADRWRAVAAGLGQPIRVNLPDRSIDGVFAGIDAQGYLILDTENKESMRIAAGDVFLLT